MVNNAPLTMPCKSVTNRQFLCCGGSSALINIYCITTGQWVTKFFHDVFQVFFFLGVIPPVQIQSVKSSLSLPFYSNKGVFKLLQYLV